MRKYIFIILGGNKHPFVMLLYIMLDKISLDFDNVNTESQKPAGLNPIEKAIKMAISHKASDVHVKSNRAARLRIACELRRTDVESTREDIFDFCVQYMPMDVEKIEKFLVLYLLQYLVPRTCENFRTYISLIYIIYTISYWIFNI